MYIHKNQIKGKVLNCNFQLILHPLLKIYFKKMYRIRNNQLSHFVSIEKIMSQSHSK